MSRLAVAFALACVFVATVTSADASVVVSIDKSTQRMSVAVDVGDTARR